MKAFKVFNQDWTCRGFKYEVGKTYEIEGSPELCKRGFHACKKVADCFSYYRFDSKNKVAEVELLGIVVGGDGDKQATNKIKIVREISWAELLELVNTGNYNTGSHNTGNYNTGNYNTGHYNTGSRNTGNYNTGSHNTGHYNTGSRNTGHYNTGSRNTGHYNTGSHNTGDYNGCDFETGFFNPKSMPIEKVRVFGKTFVERSEFTSSIGYGICCKLKPIRYRHNGRIYVMPYKHWWDCWAAGLSRQDKLYVQNMPGFDPDVFYEITGLDWRV